MEKNMLDHDQSAAAAAAWTAEEENLLMAYHKIMGNEWESISEKLFLKGFPLRTAFNLRRRKYTIVRRQKRRTVKKLRLAAARETQEDDISFGPGESERQVGQGVAAGEPDLKMLSNNGMLLQQQETYGTTATLSWNRLKMAAAENSLKGGYHGANPLQKMSSSTANKPLPKVFSPPSNNRDFQVALSLIRNEKVQFDSTYPTYQMQQPLLGGPISSCPLPGNMHSISHGQVPISTNLNHQHWVQQTESLPGTTGATDSHSWVLNFLQQLVLQQSSS